MQEARTGRRRLLPPATLQIWTSAQAASTGAPRSTADDQTRTAQLWSQVLPVGVWRETLGDAVLTARTEGTGVSLLAARGDALIRRGPVPGASADDAAAAGASAGAGASADRAAAHGEVRIDLAREDADWLWFDGDVRSVVWSVEQEASGRSSSVDAGSGGLPSITVVMPTFRREADATAQVARFAAMDVVGRIVVVDQGGTLARHEGFARLLAAQDSGTPQDGGAPKDGHAPQHGRTSRGPRIELFVQPNLGGSGGYARGMLEAASDPSAAILVSDDDAVIDEESLRRMLVLQALAERPTVVGAPLFSSLEPLRLIAHTEEVDARSFQWRPADGLRGATDLTGTTPERWGFLSAHDDANYTGWWATLFPPGTVDDLGLPLPYFLKWDDAEYGLRATARGYAHAVLPGTAVHHPPWNAHRTQMTWTARVLHRNRLATAAAYGASRGVIASSLLHQIKHILSGQHLTALLWEEGLDAFLSGPGTWLGSDLGRARSDGQRIVDAWEAEQAELAEQVRRADAVALRPTRTGPLPLPLAAARAGALLLRRDRAPRVVIALHGDEVRWRTTLGADAVVIVDDDRRPRSTMIVSARTARSLLRRTLRTHARIAIGWRRLQRRYREALPHHTAAEAWRPLFAADDAPAPTASTDRTAR